MADDDVATDDITEDDTVTDDDIASFLGDVTVEDIPDDETGFEEATTEIGDGACVVCGTPVFRPPGLTRAGQRRRVPKYCDLHNPKAQRPPLAGSSGHISVGSIDSQLQRMQEELSDDVRLLGMMAGPLFPVTGLYVIDGADQFTIALIKLCKNNQRMLRVLHRAAQIAPIYTVAEFVAGTAYSVQVDTKRADPHTGIARRLGVERVFNSLNENDAANTGNNVSSNGITPPPHYATVQ